jgi:UDP:flavonoid glycosyltransferase YjiC (YdhE family)
VRVLFPAGGGRPHLYPIVPLAWAFRAAGHEVRLAGTPGNAADLVRTGLPALTLGHGPRLSERDMRELISVSFGQRPWPADWPVNLHLLDQDQVTYLELSGRYVVAAAAGMVDDLVEFARHWRPDLIVFDGLALAGAVAAAVLDVPSVRHMYGMQSVPRVELGLNDRTPLPEYVRLFERFGVPVRTDASTNVDTVPPSMHLGIEAAHLDMRCVPFNGAGAVPDGLDGRRLRPRVCVTWGHTLSSALGAAGADPFREAIGAVAASGAEVVVLTSAAQLDTLGELPANTRAFASAPLHLVLPYCDALVQHGGDGTTLTAATAAVPQLAITGKPDNDLTGGRIAAVGAGIHLRVQELRSDPNCRDVIQAAVQRLLTEPSYLGAARRLQAEIERQPSPAAVVPALATLGRVPDDLASAPTGQGG